jgi:hypothetical protein
MNNYLNLNTYVSYNLWFFNLFSLVIGIVLLVYHYKDGNSIKDCDNIFTLLCLNLGGSVLPVITYSSIMELNVIIFFSSCALVGYGFYNYSIMAPSCISYYNNNFDTLANYYMGSLVLHALNIVLYLITFFIGIRLYCCNNEDNNENTHLLLHEDENIYENDSD